MKDYELYDIAAGIQKDRAHILANIKSVWQLAEEKADTELTYRKAYAIEVERMRIEKVPATLIRDLAEGEVAEHKRNMELASGKFRASLASLEALQTSINALMSLLKHMEKA